MLTPRCMGKVFLPVGLLASVLLLPGDGRAATTMPTVPSLEKALTLLETSRGHHLPVAALEVRAALGDLEHQNLFNPGTPVFGPPTGHHFFRDPAIPLAKARHLGPLEKLILEPRGGLYVLYNRTKVQVALGFLKAAQGQLTTQINTMKLPPNSPQAEALRHVDDAIDDVKAFLRLPFIF